MEFVLASPRCAGDWYVSAIRPHRQFLVRFTARMCALVLHGHARDEAIVDCDLAEGNAAASVNEEERIANEEAADFCVPSDRMTSLDRRKKPFFAEREVEAFAKLVGTHPGLVVRQLQRRMERYDFLRKHLIKVRGNLAMSMMMDRVGRLLRSHQLRKEIQVALNKTPRSSTPVSTSPLSPVSRSLGSGAIIDRCVVSRVFPTSMIH